MVFFTVILGVVNKTKNHFDDKNSVFYPVTFELVVIALFVQI